MLLDIEKEGFEVEVSCELPSFQENLESLVLTYHLMRVGCMIQGMILFKPALTELNKALTDKLEGSGRRGMLTF